MFEHKSQQLLSPRHFLLRTLRYAGFSVLIIGISLFIGMVGYRFFAGIGWVESFYNSSMILTGMGPGLDIEALPVEKQGGVQIFAGFFALYSGVVFLAATGLILSPVLHRFFHKMHLDFNE
jgi:hypothetical protein